MRKIFLTIAVLLTVALVASAIFWYFVLSQKPPSDITPGTKPTPGVGFGSLRPYATLCKEFQKVNYKIPCEKAVELALAQYHGKVQKISTGPVRTTVPSGSGRPERRTVEMWLIDIVLAKPYFDDKFNKQINILQIGIRVDEHNLIYKKPLE